MQRVAYFTDSTDFGGAEQALLNLLGGIDCKCWQPMLLHHAAPGLAPLLAQTQQLGIERIAVPPMPLGIEGAKALPQFVRQLQRLQPAVFHAHLTWPLACKYGLVGALVAGVPAIVATAQLFVETNYTLASRLQQRIIAAKIGRYIAVSQALAGRLSQTFAIPASKIDVIHNAIPLQKYQQPLAAILRETWCKGKQLPVILTIARLDAQKGHQYLLEAATQIPDALFVFVGDGLARTSLERQSAALGLTDRVLFLGYRQDIPTLLANCDLFVLPSLYEGLPLALLEAMAAGKPVISSDIEGTRELIVNGVHGVLVAPANPQALGQAIQHLLATPLIAQKLALAGQARVQEKFSVQTMTQQVVQVYEQLL